LKEVERKMTVFDPKAIAKMDNEQLLGTVVGKRVKFTHKERTVSGTITGGIFNGATHYYIFKAFHIVIDGTGEQVTMLANKVTIL
jgi:hypothetical protein